MSVIFRRSGLRKAGMAAVVALLAGGLATVAVAPAQAVVDPPIDLGDNADTPPMGFSTWNEFGCDVSAELILGMAQAIVDSGLKDAGYEYVNIDDCWAQTERDVDGNLVADTTKFPEGIEGLADDIHALGLKIGIYSSAGTTTCQQIYPGSIGYEYIDAKNYYAWGVDYIKYDNCGGHELTEADFDASTTWMPEDIGQGDLGAERRYERMGRAIEQVQAEALAVGDEWNVVYSICEWGDNDPWVWGTSVGGMLWRTTFDISDTFDSVLSILDQQVGLEDFSGPNAWNDPDMLEVGNGGMTVEEYRTHFSLWALLNAPLIAGNDIRLMDTEEERADATVAAYHDILTNADVIAVDQDWAGKQGYRLRDDGDIEVWAKPMSDGESVAIVLLNRGLDDVTASVDASELAAAGLGSGTAYEIDDLWSDEVTSSTGTVRASLGAHGSRMFIVTPADDTTAAPAVTIDVTGDRYVEPGDTTTVEVTVHDDGAVDLDDVEVALTAPSGWAIVAQSVETTATLEGGGEFVVEYELTPGAAAALGETHLAATADYSVDGGEHQATAGYLLYLVEGPGEGVHAVSDIDWVRSSNTGENPVGRDVSTDGTTLNVNGTEYDKGIGTLAPGIVVVYLGAQCSTFESFVGVQLGGGGGGGFPLPPGSSYFEVWGDGVLLYSSDLIGADSDVVATGEIDVTGVKVLELRTLDSGAFFTISDKGNWIEPTLTCGDAETPVPTLTVEKASVAAGDEQTVMGEGFEPGETFTATLHSAPVVLGTVTVGSDGTFGLTFTVPATFDLGTHSVVLTQGADTIASVSFTVTAASLAVTGSSLFAAGISLACVLLISGGVLAAARYRQRRVEG